MIHREKLEIVEDYAEPVASRWSSGGISSLSSGGERDPHCWKTRRNPLPTTDLPMFARRRKNRDATVTGRCRPMRCDAMRCDTVTMDRSKLRRWVLSESRRGRGEKEVKNTIRIISYLSYGRPGATSDYEGYCLYAREYTN